jgi:hypothetical protein
MIRILKIGAFFPPRIVDVNVVRKKPSLSLPKTRLLRL